MLARRQSSLLRKHRSSGFNPKWLADPKFNGLGLYTIAQVLRWQQAKAKVNNK